MRERIVEIFEVPKPVKKLFDAVPLVTYPSNELPERSPEKTELCSLYVFCTADDAERGRPSYNPGCLKWQVCREIEWKRQWIELLKLTSM